MSEIIAGLPQFWDRFEPLLKHCAHAELTSAVLIGDGVTRNVFSVLTFTRQRIQGSIVPTFKFLTDRPESVLHTSYKLAIALSTMSSIDALRAVPTAGQFIEPVKEETVECPGTWADPIFVGQEVHRLSAVVPSIDAQYWVFQHVPPPGLMVELVGNPGLNWILEKVSTCLARTLTTRSDYAGGFLVVLPEYRGEIRVERGNSGRVGIEYRGDREQVHPIVSVRSTRNDELCSSVVADLTSRYTVLDAGASDFEEIELYDLNSGLILDRHAGTPWRGFELAMNVGEQVEFDVTLHDAAGQPSGSPVHINTNWGRIQLSGIDQRSGWEHIQRQAAILSEQKRLHGEGRLFFYSGKDNDREKAVSDVRNLIRMHSRQRLCIWDPYFGGRDALEFLPYVGDPSISVRVLTSCTSIGESTQRDVKRQLEEAISALGQHRGRGPGMTNIQARLGTGFHDRFLITDVSCWQLGTSFNHVGLVYSTIVEFPYADLVLRAFETAWNAATMIGSAP